MILVYLSSACWVLCIELFLRFLQFLVYLSSACWVLRIELFLRFLHFLVLAVSFFLCSTHVFLFWLLCLREDIVLVLSDRSHVLALLQNKILPLFMISFSLASYRNARWVPIFGVFLFFILCLRSNGAFILAVRHVLSLPPAILMHALLLICVPSKLSMSLSPYSWVFCSFFSASEKTW